MIIVVSSISEQSKIPVTQKLSQMLKLSVVRNENSLLEINRQEKIDFYEEASITINSILKTYDSLSMMQNVIIPFHPAEWIAMLELKMLRIDPLTRSTIEHLIKEAYREIKALKKPNFIIYIEPVTINLVDKWLNKKLLSIYRDQLNIKEILHIKNTDDLDKCALFK